MAGRKKKGADLTKVIIVVLVLAGLYLGYQQMSGDEGLVAEARHRRKKAAVKKPVNRYYDSMQSLRILPPKFETVYAGCPNYLPNVYLGSFTFQDEGGNNGGDTAIREIVIKVGKPGQKNLIQKGYLILPGGHELTANPIKNYLSGQWTLTFKISQWFVNPYSRFQIRIFADMVFMEWGNDGQLGQQRVFLSIDKDSIVAIPQSSKVGSTAKAVRLIKGKNPTQRTRGILFKCVKPHRNFSYKG